MKTEIINEDKREILKRTGIGIMGVAALSMIPQALARATVKDEGDTVWETSKDGTTSFVDLTTKAGRIKTPTRVTTTYTILLSDELIFADTDSEAFTVTLPPGVQGQYYRIVNTGTTTNSLEVAPDGTDLLMGENSSFTLNPQEALILVYDSTEGWD